MKNVLITLILGVINSVIQAAFEPIPFNPKIESLTAYNNAIKITGFTLTPFNFNSLNSKYLISELNIKKHSFLINAKKLGESIYSENQISLHYKTPPKFLYRSIVGINFYQILFNKYGTASLITADIGLSFQLKPNISSAVFFQNILKNTASIIHDDISSNIIFLIHDKMSPTLQINYQLQRLGGHYSMNIFSMDWDILKNFQLGVGYETYTQSLKLSTHIKTAYFSMFFDGIIHPVLGISKIIGFEIIY
jgi:hypothetical protein